MSEFAADFVFGYLALLFRAIADPSFYETMAMVLTAITLGVFSALGVSRISPSLGDANDRLKVDIVMGAGLGYVALSMASLWGIDHPQYLSRICWIGGMGVAAFTLPIIVVLLRANSAISRWVYVRRTRGQLSYGEWVSLHDRPWGDGFEDWRKERDEAAQRAARRRGRKLPLLLFNL
jgi:hypothetical protein